MFQYRAVLVRMRQGDSDRDIARARLMGRRKVAAFRALATFSTCLKVIVCALIPATAAACFNGRSLSHFSSVRRQSFLPGALLATH